MPKLMPNYLDNLPPLQSQSCWHCGAAFESRRPGLCFGCYLLWIEKKIVLPLAQQAELAGDLNQTVRRMAAEATDEDILNIL